MVSGETVYRRDLGECSIEVSNWTSSARTSSVSLGMQLVTFRSVRLPYNENLRLKYDPS